MTNILGLSAFFHESACCLLRDGVLVAAAGAAWIGYGAGEGENRLLGDLSVVGAVAVYGAYVMFARALKDQISGWPYAASVYFVAAACLVVLANSAFATIEHRPLIAAMQSAKPCTVSQYNAMTPGAWCVLQNVSIAGSIDDGCSSGEGVSFV